MFEVTKEAQKVKNFLISKMVRNVKAEVIGLVDKSGSMQGLYKCGAVQEAIQRVLPVGLNFDDNGNVDVFTFADGEGSVFEAAGLDTNNFEGYVQREILNKNGHWGGTDYAPAITAVLKSKGFAKKSGGGFFGGGSLSLQENSTSGYPALIYFFTDGANDDESATEKLLEAMQYARVNAYVLFVGIGDNPFRFCIRVADKFDNTGFVRVSDLAGVANNDKIYEMLLPDELCCWLRNKK